MMQWAGLWNPDRPRAWREKLPAYVVIYLLVPLVLALMQASRAADLVSGIARAYPSAFVISSTLSICFELEYSYLWPRLIIGKPSWPVRIAGHAVAVVLAVFVGGIVTGILGQLLWDVPAATMRQIVWQQASVIAVVVVAILVTTDELSARAREHERKATEARVALLRAELSALQARTDPHFLFNSLNTVAALIPDDPPLAETVLERLAVVFRYALDAGRRERVPLDEELTAVHAYLEVEALRLGDRLVWHIDRDGDLDGVTIPPLVLQPLAENAIRHGAGSRLGATKLVVTVRRDLLVVEDRPHGPQRGTAARPQRGAGVALDELRERLALAYGDRATLTAGPSADGWRAEIAIR